MAAPGTGHGYWLQHTDAQTEAWTRGITGSRSHSQQSQNLNPGFLATVSLTLPQAGALVWAAQPCAVMMITVCLHRQPGYVEGR